MHLTIRYLIINTVNSLKYLLNSETKEQIGKNECDKYKKIKEYSILLSNLFEILGNLLRNLLSSHVDNYRDSIILDQTINLLIILINYLTNNYASNSYSYSLNNNSNCNILFSEENNNYNIIEYLQNLIYQTLSTFKEICKFNTSIKLNFERIIEKISENPSNKAPMIYILNFMLNIVNNEYTIETFVENFKKPQKNLTIDFYNDLEYNIKANSVKLSYIFEDKSFIKYIIEIGLSSESEWLVDNCANFLLTLQRLYVLKSKENLYLEIREHIFNSLISIFNKISKIESFNIFSDKVNK
jgi:hypothetical protein